VKKPASVVLTLFLVATMSGQSGNDRNAAQSNREAFVGAWQLASLEEPGADGAVHKADCTGMLVYTRDGHMSVQLMYRTVRPASSDAPVQYAHGGYEASFGTYRLDDDHTFTFHVEGALVRALVGKTLRRAYELSDKRLVVRSSDPNEHWRVIWERF